MANANGHKIYRFDEFSLDAEILMLKAAGRELDLPPKAVRTLAVLVENQGEILSKEELIEAIWGDNVVEESNLSQHLYLLRKALGNRPDGGPYIETLRRRGYRFTGTASILKKPSTAQKKSPPFGPASSQARRIEPEGDPLPPTEWTDPDGGTFSPGTLIARSGRKVIAGSAMKTALAVFVLSASYAIFWLATREEQAAEPPDDLISVRLTNGLVPLEATISPDGKYFVYHELEGDLNRLWVQQTGQSNRIEVIPPTKRLLLFKTFTPDGHFIYFLARDLLDPFYSLFRVPTLGGPETKILDDVSSYVSFSPDGSRMVFYRYNPSKGVNAYYSVPSDGKGEEILLYKWDDDRTNFGNPAWSPDGKFIVFGEKIVQGTRSGSCSLVAIPAGGGHIRPVNDERWGSCWRIEWSRDGRGLYLIGSTEADEKAVRRDAPYYVPYPLGKPRRLTNDDGRYQGYSLGVTDDGALLVTPYNRFSQIWAMDPNGDSRTAVQITSGSSDGRPGIAPMADGRVAYVTRVSDSLGVWAMNPDGSDQKQLTVDPAFVEEVRAGGGPYLVFSGRQGNFQHLFRINADGTDMRQLTFGESFEGDSSISSDGKWVAYGSTALNNNSEEWSLWKVPIGGGEPISLNRSDCNRPHFSPDDSLLSCVSRFNKEIKIISSIDGTLIKSFPASPYAGLNFGAKWSPDGQAVVYVDVYDGKASNLLLQPIDGGPPTQLTDFTTGTIYHFAYSRDGSRLYLARGQQIRDAVLIRPLN